jgi:trehalose 6-phosphate synthase/phosphatase
MSDDCGVTTTEPQAPAGKLIVVSNRLPVTYDVDGDGFRLRASSGGLASALAGLPRDERFTWVGWVGDVVADAHQAAVREELAAQRLAPVFLTAQEEQLYYKSACNEVIWPLCHYFVSKVDYRPEAWDAYVAVNQLFADAVLAQCEGDEATVWVHDFHLMLLPRLLRMRRPDLAIGFFLHIPFPSSETYRLLPPREAVLQGLLGADHVAFHTSDYALHFRRACLRVLGMPSERDEIEFEGRRVRIGVHPIGPDVGHFQRWLADPATDAQLAELRQSYGKTKLVLGIERLDYSKGVLLKLDAFERFLARNPAHAAEVTLLQVIVPSRLASPEYQQLKSRIEQRVAEINGRYGRPGVVPVHYMHRSVSPAELTALYRFAHLAMVTPMRDGMNLVAQEYVLCQVDDDGMLLLSEFAGAAQVLSGAILVNPWDVERTAQAIEDGLNMRLTDRRSRMQAMRRRVEALDCRAWAQGCLDALRRAASKRREDSGVLRVDEATFAAVAQRADGAVRRVLLLDYDGTLREISRRPTLATPTDELLQLLAALAAAPRVQVHVVSGRDRETMGDWLGSLPIWLCAEHGYAARAPGGDWTVREVDLSWMPRVRKVLEQVADDVPHSFVEAKAASLAWHYRLADLDYGTWRARELQNALEQVLANEPAEVLHGNAVIEVRSAAVHKGVYARSVLDSAPVGTFVLAMGDDRTDDDLFKVLPADAVSVRVGARRGQPTTLSVPSPAYARALLHRLVANWT